MFYGEHCHCVASFFSDLLSIDLSSPEKLTMELAEGQTNLSNLFFKEEESTTN